MVNFRYPYSNELYHHGIKGQKWGVRRFQNKDGSLTKAGRDKYQKFGFRNIKAISEKDRFKNADYLKRTEQTQHTINEIQKWNDKERLKIYKTKNLIAALKLKQYKMSRINDDIDSKNKLPLKKKESTIEQDAKIVNPQWESTKASSSNNCCLCTMAYDMRRRGYDVISRQNAPINLLYDISSEDLKWAYPKAKEIKTGSYANLQTELNKQPNGSRGAVFMSWPEGLGGHVVAYEVKNGNAMLVDSQTGEIHKKFKGAYADIPEKTSYIRLDNIEPNYNLIKVAIQ